MEQSAGPMQQAGGYPPSVQQQGGYAPQQQQTPVLLQGHGQQQQQQQQQQFGYSTGPIQQTQSPQQAPPQTNEPPPGQVSADLN